MCIKLWYFFFVVGILEEKIERLIGLLKGLWVIGNNFRCLVCEVKGVVECVICVGLGLYVDVILES